MKKDCMKEILEKKIKKQDMRLSMILNRIQEKKD